MPRGSDEDTIDPFAGLEAAVFGRPVLSLYLPLPSGRPNWRALVGQVAEAEFENPPGDLAEELEGVIAELEQRHFECPGLAVFSCRSLGIFQLWRLPEPVPPRLAWAGWFDLEPIRAQLERRPPTLIVVVDKEGARVFSAVLDQTEELLNLEGIEVSRHRQGGWSAADFQRHEDEQARANLASAARAVERLLDRGFHRRLVLAGPPEARAELERLLSPRARAAVALRGRAERRIEGVDLHRSLRRLLDSIAGGRPG
ncbi:MAG TPA: Vms1/Ankzf1 family peptidyl-tRNA hydrolase [Candidatus Dormibacteraeota bacterium]|jgi:peptide subunit release factor 1 (eRF1)|nr:Vms1/Ankzf1 family peptidyl-tRNA hydrolase [Candidatus Dormibacteraeota bacterium]